MAKAKRTPTAFPMAKAKRNPTAFPTRSASTILTRDVHFDRVPAIDVAGAWFAGADASLYTVFLDGREQSSDFARNLTDLVNSLGRGGPRLL